MHRGRGKGGVLGAEGGHQYSRKQYRPHCDSLGGGGQETLWMEEWVMWDIRPANATRWDMPSLPSLHRHLDPNMHSLRALHHHLDPTNATRWDMHSLLSLHRHLDPTNAHSRDMHSLCSLHYHLDPNMHSLRALHRHLDPTNAPSAGVCPLSAPSTVIWIRIMHYATPRDMCSLDSVTNNIPISSDAASHNLDPIVY
jgi:hypothetical protein